MGALTVVFGVLVVAGAIATVLVPGVRRMAQALALTTALTGGLALTLGSVAVFAVEVIGALVLLGLMTVMPALEESRPPRLQVRSLLVPAALALILLGALVWATLAAGWPGSSVANGSGVGAAFGRDQLVPLIVCIILVLSAVFAVLTLREPRAAHRGQASPPRRSGSASPPRRGNRPRGRR